MDSFRQEVTSTLHRMRPGVEKWQAEPSEDSAADLRYAASGARTLHVPLFDQSLELENRLLARDLLEAKKDSSKNRSRLAEAIKSINALALRLEEEQSSATLCKARCEQLEASNRRLEEELEESRLQARDRQQEAEELLARLAEAERRLKDQARQADCQAEENRRQAQELGSLTKTCNELLQEASGLQQQVLELGQSHRELQQANSDMAQEVDIGDEIERKQREEIGSLNNRIAWLKQEHRMQQEAAAEAASELQRELEASRAAHQQLAQELEAGARRLDREKQDWAAKQGKLQDHIVELKELNDEYELLHEESKEKFAQLQEERNALLDQLAEFGAQHGSPEPDNRFSFRRREPGSTPAHGSLKVRLDSPQDFEEALAQVKEECGKLEQENLELEQKLEEAARHVEQSQDREQEREEEMEVMKGEMAELLDTIEALEEEKKGQQALHDEICEKIGQEHERMESLKAFVLESQSEHQRELQDLARELGEARDQLAQREARMQEVLGYLKNTREDNCRLKAQLAAADAKVATLSQLLTQRFKKLESYRLALDDIRQTKASDDSA